MTIRSFSAIANTTAAAFLLAMGNLSAAAPPTPAKIDGEKVLTLVISEPPGVRCNNNVQVGTELANKFHIPLVVLPKGLAGEDAKAPAVYYGDETIAVAGGKLNGMISFTRMNDFLTLEAPGAYGEPGRLFEGPVKEAHNKLKRAIKDTE